MNTQRLTNIIVSPRISEKATTRADLDNQHVFSVLKDATKPEVKKAVELMFDVKVRSSKTNECSRQTYKSWKNIREKKRLEKSLRKTSRGI